MKPNPLKSPSLAQPHEPFLTPTTLKRITQILESEECLKSIHTFETTGKVEVPSLKEKIQQQERPRRKATFFNLNPKSWQGGTTTICTTPTKASSETSVASVIDPSLLPEPVVQRQTRMLTRSSTRPPAVGSNSVSTPASTSKSAMSGGRRKGGRRPPPGCTPEDALSAEERERLRVRRMRNKEAAARCRKRRVDQTNSLQEEVDLWQAKKQALEAEIQELQDRKKELEFILDNHYSAQDCRLQFTHMDNLDQSKEKEFRVTFDLRSEFEPSQVAPCVVAVKSEPVIVESADAPYLLPEEVVRPKRPDTLSFGLQTEPKKEVVEGIPIETPSSVIPGISFDHLVSVSTGLTPTAVPVVSKFGVYTPTLNTPVVAPTCSNQQRTSQEMDNNKVDNYGGIEGGSLVSL